jgi:hypothetical protein
MRLRQISLTLLAVVACWLMIGSQCAEAKPLCGGCTASYVLVPCFRTMPELFTLDSSDGRLDYISVNQIVPVMATKYWCMCLDEAGHAGPNDPPQTRRCQEYAEEIPGSADQYYLEQPYCQWKNDIPGSGGCGGTHAACPDM